MSAHDAPAGPFSLGSNIWPGAGKVVEEASEVLQVAGKLIASGGEPDHWDGQDLAVELGKEIADLQAALELTIAHNRGLNADAIADRRHAGARLADADDQGPFSRGNPVWPGLGGVLKTAGRTVRLIGDLLEAGGTDKRLDGSSRSKDLTGNIADLQAALDIIIARNGLLDADTIDDRRGRKRLRFEDWHMQHLVTATPTAVESSNAPTVEP